MKNRSFSVRARLTLVALFIVATSYATHAGDYYVDAVSGNNANSGASPAQAWRTITRAISALPAVPTGAPEVIHVAPGVYDQALGEVFPYYVMFHDGIQIVGEGGRDVTIIDGGGTPLLIRDVRNFHSGFPGQQTALVGLTLRNAQTAILFGSNSYDCHLLCRDLLITNTSGFGLVIESGVGTGPGGNAIGLFDHVEVIDCRGAVSITSRGSLLEHSGMFVAFSDCTIADNRSEGVRIAHGQAEISSVAFLRSRITGNGRGGVLVQQTQESNSGGVTDTQFQDCLVARNLGPGVDVAYAGTWTPPYTTSSITTSILRCTIADNAGTGLDVATTTIDPALVQTTLSSTILHGNAADVLDHATQPSIANPSYCDVGQGNFAGSNGNISADPLFRAPAQGDYRLVWASPCIDVGYSIALPLPAPDLAGHARSTDGNLDTLERADMGALEFEPLGLVGSVHVGGSCTLEHWGPAGGAATLFVARGLPLATPVSTPFGELELGAARNLGAARVAAGPPALRVLYIPNTPTYAGLTMTLQALSTSTVASPAQAYTNSVTLTIVP